MAHYPAIAQSVLRALEQNELAYSIVADSGRLTFDLDVKSVPTGAVISYKRRGDDYRRNADPTDATIKALPYAIWVVQFQKTGYQNEEREHDPFREPNHVLTIELHLK
jgi:hypothetical protein